MSEVDVVVENDEAPQPLPKVFDHPAELIASHIAFVESTIKTIKKLAALDRVDGLITHFTTAEFGEIIEVKKKGGEVIELKSLKCRFQRSRMLNLAIDLGIKKAYFVPGLRPDLSKGIPKEVSQEWITLGDTIYESGEDGESLIAITDKRNGIGGLRGYVIIEPKNGHEAFLGFLDLLKNNPNSFGIHVAARLSNFPESLVKEPSPEDYSPLSPEQSWACAYHLRNVLTFLWGPPGTGKSTVLSKMTSLNLAADRTVLVTAASNDAIDSVAEKLCSIHEKGTDAIVSEAIDDCRVVRFGGSVRAPYYRAILQQRVKRELKKLEGPTAELDPDAALATFHRLFVSPPTLYDTVFIEEAGMVPPPVAYAIACLAKSKVVLCGDPKQAQPIFTGSARDFGKKIVEHWKSNVFDFAGLRINPGQAPDSRVVILATQYRFVQEILDYVSATELYIDYRCPSPPRPLDRQESVARGADPLPGQSVVVIDTSALATDRPSKHFNNTHFQAVIGLIERWHRSGMSARIGITAPYSEQAQAYRKWVRANNHENITANTIHGFQGSEFPALIYDTVEGPGADEFFGSGRGRNFLTDEKINREAIFLHNVGISRAKAKLIFVINVQHVRNTFSPGAYLRRLISMAAERGSIVDAKSLRPNGLVLEHAFDSAPAQFPDSTFNAQLKADIMRARRSVEIASSQVDSQYLKAFAKLLMKARPSEAVSLILYGPRHRSADLEEFPDIQYRSLKSYDSNGFVCIDGELIYAPTTDDDVTAPLAGYVPALIERVRLD